MAKSSHKAWAEFTGAERQQKYQADKLRRVTKLAEAVRTLPAANDAIASHWLTIEHLEAMLKRSRASIYRDIRDGKIPPPTKLSARCSRWNAATVATALANLTV